MCMFEDWFDPCPLNPNPILDGLTLDWPNKTYVNPPYSNPLPWVEKAIETKNKGHIVAMLLRADTSTKVFAKLIESKARIFWLYGRISFERAKEDRVERDRRNIAMFPSMLVILHPEVKKLNG